MSGRRTSQMGSTESKEETMPGVFQDERDKPDETKESNTNPLFPVSDGANIKNIAPVTFVFPGLRYEQRQSSPETTKKIGSSVAEDTDAMSIELESDPRTLRGFFASSRKPKSTAVDDQSTRLSLNSGPDARPTASRRLVLEDLVPRRENSVANKRGESASPFSFRYPVPESRPPSLLENVLNAQTSAPPPANDPSVSTKDTLGNQARAPLLFGDLSGTSKSSTHFTEPKISSLFEGTTKENVSKGPSWAGNKDPNTGVPGLTKSIFTTDTSTTPQPAMPPGNNSVPAPSIASKYQGPAKHLFDKTQPPATMIATSPGAEKPSFVNRESELEDSTSPTKKSPTTMTPDDFLKRAGELLDLEAPNMALLKADLMTLHKVIATFTQIISQTAEFTSRSKAYILNKDSEISKLKNELSATPIGTGNLNLAREAKIQALNHLRQRVMSINVVVKQQESKAASLQHSFMGSVLAPLETFSRLNKASWEEQLEKKNEYINELRLKMLQLEQDLATATSNLTSLRAQSEELYTKLITAETEATSQHNEHRKKLDNRIAEKDFEKNDALRAQRLQYQAQIEKAKATEQRCKKATTKMDELEETVNGLEREKADLNLAKAAVEKEFRDLELQVDQWKSYKDAYNQIKDEFEELQGSYNDVMAERDELTERVEALEATKKDGTCEKPGLAVSQVSSATPRQLVGAHTTDSDHLDGLKDHWSNRVKLTMESVERKRADIAWHDSEIASLRRLFEAPPMSAPRPTKESRSSSLSTVDTTGVQPLDVGKFPKIGEDQAVDFEPGATQQVPRQAGPPSVLSGLRRFPSVPSQTWVSMAAGAAPYTPNAGPPQAPPVGPRRERPANSTLYQDYMWQDVVRSRRGKDGSSRRD